MATAHPSQGSLGRLRRDLDEIFGTRLRSVVAYDADFDLDGPIGSAPASEQKHVHTMVIVDSLQFADLAACARQRAGWGAAGLATPLLLTKAEFSRSLDAFPLELHAMAGHHTLVAGVDPFDDARIDAADVRRACETQAKSHLLHLREGFLEARADPTGVAALIAASVPALRTLLLNLAYLDGAAATSREKLAEHAAGRIGVPPALLERLLALHGPRDLESADAVTLYTAYLDAVERLTAFIDSWNRR